MLASFEGSGTEVVGEAVALSNIGGTEEADVVLVAGEGDLEDAVFPLVDEGEIALDVISDVDGSYACWR